MTEEELHEAQPAKDFKFQLVDTEVKLNYRDVVVPNWIARDGHWADVYNALGAARNSEMAKATEMIVKAMERARQFGREEEIQSRAAEESAHVPPLTEGERRFREAHQRKLGPDGEPWQQMSPMFRDFPNKGDQG